MENSSIDSGIEPVNTESKIPLILAIAAFVLGGLSFVFAWSTKSALNRHKDNIVREVSEAVEASKQAAADARNAGTGDERISTLITDFEELKATVKSEYAKIAKSQEQIVKNAVTQNDRIARLEGNGGARPGPVAATPNRNNEASETPAPVVNGKYKVEKGDYPGKIAKKLGVSTKELLDANPGLDPKKLQIGQELNVPAK